VLDLCLIRHAESLGNLTGDSADTDLTSNGEAQARALAPVLSAVDFDQVWSSPLRRARQTTAYALPHRVPILDPRLIELRTVPSIKFVDPADAAGLSALLLTTPEVSESGKEFMERIGSWRAALPGEGRVVVFTHFGVVREILAAFLGFGRAPQRIDHASIFRLRVGGGEVEVLAWNQPSLGT
jgi:probable phosphoglycerate mutase